MSSLLIVVPVEVDSNRGTAATPDDLQKNGRRLTPYR